MDIKKMLEATRRMRVRKATEDTVEGYLREQVRLRGGVAVKLLLLTGWPDRMVLLPGGVLLFVELKRPVGGRDEPMQPHVQRRLKKLGFAVYKLNTKEQIDKVLENHA